MDSYETIFNRMRATYEELTGGEMQEESDITIRMKTLAGEIFRQAVNMDFLKRQMFPSTAGGEFLDRHAAVKGIVRRAAEKAVGTVRFYRAEGFEGSVTVPEGTSVCSYLTHLRYVTKETATLAIGEEYVNAAASAVEAGTAYNANSGTVTELVTPIAGIGAVRAGSFRGGVEEESDETLRERLLASYTDIPNGTNAAYYKAKALSVSGIKSAGVIARARGIGTVDVYVTGDGASVPAAKLQEVQEVLDKARELCTDVRVRNATAASIRYSILLSVKDGYGFDEVKNAITDAVERYIASLGIGKNVLIADISEIVYHTEGVKNFRMLEIDGLDYYIDDDRYAELETLNIRERDI